MLARDNQFHLTAEQKTNLAALEKTLGGAVNEAKSKADKAYKVFRIDAGPFVRSLSRDKDRL